MSSLPAGGRHREAQALPLPEWHAVRREIPRGLQEMGAKGEDVEERVEMAKRHYRASSQ